MKSTLAKVLHPLLGKPMVAHVAAWRPSRPGLSSILVVNHWGGRGTRAFSGSDVMFARQEETRGTGDAVASALKVLPENGTVVVMAGDAPLLRAETIAALRGAHGDAAVTVLTAQLEDGAHYGRLERDAAGQPWRIVEAKEASAAQLAIGEINTGLYCFDIAWLRSVLPTLKPHAHKNEIYLTDVVERAASEGGAVRFTATSAKSRASMIATSWHWPGRSCRSAWSSSTHGTGSTLSTSARWWLSLRFRSPPM